MYCNITVATVSVLNDEFSPFLAKFLHMRIKTNKCRHA